MCALSGSLSCFLKAGDTWRLPGGSDSKESACNAEDPGSIPCSGRCPGEGNGNPLQYSCLENSVDRGDLRATVHGVTKSQTRLSNSQFHFTFNTWRGIRRG